MIPRQVLRAVTEPFETSHEAHLCVPFRSYLYNSFPPYLAWLENAFCSDCKRKLHLICFLPDLTLGFSLLPFLYLGSNNSAQNRSVFKKHQLDRPKTTLSGESLNFSLYLLTF